MRRRRAVTPWHSDRDELKVLFAVEQSPWPNGAWSPLAYVCEVAGLAWPQPYCED